METMVDHSGPGLYICNRVASGAPSQDFGGTGSTAASKALERLGTETEASEALLDFFFSGL